MPRFVTEKKRWGTGGWWRSDNEQVDAVEENTYRDHMHHTWRLFL